MEEAGGGFHYLRNRDWWRGLARTAFGRSFWGFMVAAFLFGLICWAVKGWDVVVRAFFNDIELLLNLLPRVLIALTIAALVWVLLPRDRMSAMVGKESGLRGLALATVAGTVTPGGPSTAYSLLAVMGLSGADRGAMVTYIVAWATLGVQRILVWDFPFMGTDFAFLRFAVTLPLPILAGLIARRLPMALTIKDSGLTEGKS